MTPATTWLIIALLFWILADVAPVAHHLLDPEMPLSQLKAAHSAWTFVGTLALLRAAWLFWWA